MPESDLETKAKDAIESILEGGQSVTQGDLQVSKASLAATHAILVHEEQRQASKSGRRPLFRGINISGIN
jgi:hypothetical protein